MRDQMSLLRKCEWNVLVILDACRPDALDESLGPVEVVHSPAHYTDAWIREFGKVFAGEPLVYVSANPVVEWRAAKWAKNWEFRSVWRDGWAVHGPYAMPSVRPDAVTRAVAGYIAACGQPERMVVHFLQPHVPFIGAWAVPYAGWSRKLHDPLSEEVRRYPSLEEAIAAGDVTPLRARQAYIGNLEVAIPPLKRLIEYEVHGQVIVTSDHGELLGEQHPDGRAGWGHAEAHPKLHEVPWRQFDRGTLKPAPLARLETPADPGIEEKLQALGYA